MSTKISKIRSDKRCKYDDAFKAEALRLASKSRRTEVATQQLRSSPKLRYR
jgi:transposase